MLKKNSGLMDYLQQRNAITVLRSLHHIANPHWSLVKTYAIEKLGASSLSDYSYRRLCKQLVTLEWAKAIERDPVKSDYHLTERGHATAKILEEALRRIERWKTRARMEKE